MKQQLQYKFNYIENCNMCGSPTDKHKILGKRLNKSQGKNPKNKIGISTTICKCNVCGLIYSNPQPIPFNIQNHYGIPPEDYWKNKDFTINDHYFKEEIEIIKSTTSDYKAELKKVLTSEELIKFQNLIKRVPVAENVIEFAVKFVNSTRPANNANGFIKESVAWGAGPRASQYLILAAKTKAVVEGRFTPSIDDVKAFLIPVLRHRIIPNFSAEAEGINSLEIIKKLI